MILRHDRGDGVELAYSLLPGAGPTVVFLPGFRSDMNGAKALDLEAFCEARGQAMLRLDYSGHGASGGDFLEGTIGVWLADALRIIDHATSGKLILIGSSMGGWIAVLAALARAERVAALVGIAAASDFTERLMWQAMLPAERESLLRDGVLPMSSEYGEPYPITFRLIEDGRAHLVLQAPIPLACPVRLLAGQRDADVPWELALTLAATLESQDVETILVKDGDHRLSRPQDLALLRATLAQLLGGFPCQDIA